ncbi:conjugative transposon protein TraN [Flavobacterium sp. YO12]|uniref:conjugative transposon protein TraN n=1 Tax=Flavobacterium sp. YO12 TaxID=1920029 RepID=UPI00100B512A|nr:conjugative transposon protein TraN [Flavobacterium sp. YO12]RXM48111.1 conjugative transposon protein TraN [Flavobacterium sp. YO12]
MKNINKFYFMCFFLIMLSGHAQFNSRDSASGQEDFKNLHIGYSKTTSIVFPYAIRSIDKGSGDILMQKAKGVENILLLKAAKENFTQTNITVVTADNRLYVFLLNYDDVCPDLNIKADKTAVVNDGILFSLENENQKEIEQYAQRALFKKKKVSGLQYSEFGIQLSVNGIFIHQDLLFFRVVLSNNSKINYDIDQFRFFIRDQKKSKRTASQEIEILPLYCTSLVSSIPDKSELTLVYAVSKFTIPEKKYLTLQLMEKNGGRNLEINIKNKDLVNLEILNSF